MRDHEGSFLVAAGGVAVESFEDGLQAGGSWGAVFAVARLVP